MCTDRNRKNGFVRYSSSPAFTGRPIITKRKGVKALILTPTRELALQISECLDEYARYTPVRHGVMFGGVNQRPQVTMLQKGIDILVATPGRLLDL